jgi:hypothetical protein
VKRLVARTSTLVAGAKRARIQAVDHVADVIRQMILWQPVMQRVRQQLLLFDNGACPRPSAALASRNDRRVAAEPEGLLERHPLREAGVCDLPDVPDQPCVDESLRERRSRQVADARRSFAARGSRASIQWQLHAQYDAS